jgi:glycosyltransferase involved in cell wall biosynthesis
VVKSSNEIDISILIATYNRAEILRQALESMTRLDRNGLSVEFVVVDNNSSDHTKEVIESFTDRLPISYLFEPRPGKNSALNKALKEVPLGRLVVFTDDDVAPQEDWFKAIIAITNRWPDCSAFGGKILAIWPDGHPPKWARNRSIQALGFAVQDYADFECLYAQGESPFGSNLWVRREVLANGRLFSESIGPRPTDRTMGSETSFLKKLREDGYEILYSPNSVVRHLIKPEEILVSNILKRAYRYGKGIARSQFLCRQELFIEYPALWYLIRVAALVLLIVKFAVGLFSLSQAQRVESTVYAIEWISYNLESIRIANKIVRQKSQSGSAKN